MAMCIVLLCTWRPGKDANAPGRYTGNGMPLPPACQAACPPPQTEGRNRVPAPCVDTAVALQLGFVFRCWQCCRSKVFMIPPLLFIAPSDTDPCPSNHTFVFATGKAKPGFEGRQESKNAKGRMHFLMLWVYGRWILEILQIPVVNLFLLKAFDFLAFFL